MLERIDRVQLVVPDRVAASDGWMHLLGAEVAGKDTLRCLGAQRTSLRLGRGWIELLSPDGSGPVADALEKRGAHLFSAGVSTSEMNGVLATLEKQGVTPTLEGQQAFIDPSQTANPGLRVVISPEETLEKVGDIEFLYEVTLLAGDAHSVSNHVAALFGLNGDVFVPINSERYGYDGVLTLFHRDRLHRFEAITPTDPAKTMGRFFALAGDSYYMAFAESGALAEIEQRALAQGAGYTSDPPADGRDGAAIDTLFLHPSALGGMMLGISRPTQAWQWSGHPERVEPAK